jgi:hemoglobin/transferrin/lactoferrin receptor protein
MRLVIVIGCFLLAQLGWSQVIHGVVLDKKSNQPVHDVHVQWINTSFGTVTNQEGNFELRSVNGANTIRVSAVGYATQDVKLEDSETSLTVILEPSVLLLNQEVMITANRQENLIINIPQSVTVLSNEQLIKNAPRTTPEALMNQSGIWVQKTNHGGGSPIIRGLVGNQVLVLVDGIRLNNSTYRYGPNQYLNTIDPGSIERIEAVRGSGSVLYGSDALGGVINVLSKTPSFSMAQPQITGSIMGKWMSGEMEQSGRAEIEIATKQIAFLGGFSERHFGDLVAGGNLGTLSPTAYNERAGDAKMLIRTGSSGLLTAAYQYVAQRDVPRYDQVALGGYSFYNFDPQSRQLGYLKWETNTRKPWMQSIRLTTSFSRTVEGVTSQKVNSSTLKKNYDEVNTISFIAEVVSNPVRQWNAQSGIEYYYDLVASEAKESNATTNAETMLRGSYADGSTASNLAFYTNHQLDWHKFQFSGGLRFNTVQVSVEDATFGNQKINPTAWVGNLGMMYAVTPAIHAVLTSNTGFRAPNVDDMSKFGAVEANVFEIPTSDLSPEKSFTIETGFKFNAKKFSGALIAYQIQLNDLIDRTATTYEGSSTYEGKNVYQKRNVGKALIKGIEAEGELSILPRFSLTGNFTYTHGENRTKQEPMRRIPPLFGQVGLRYQNKQGWWLKGELTTASEQDRLAAGDKSDVRIASRLVDGVMPGWNCWNIYAGYQYKSIRLQASLQNMFDSAYRMYASGVDAYGRNINVMLIIRQRSGNFKS